MLQITDDRLDIIINKFNTNKHVIPVSYCNCYTRDTLSVFESGHDVIIKHILSPGICSVYTYKNKNIDTMCKPKVNIYNYLYSAYTNQCSSGMKKPSHKITIEYSPDDYEIFNKEDIIDEE